MKTDVPASETIMEEQAFIQTDDIDEEIEIIDENELREINELDLNDEPIDDQQHEQQADGQEDDELATENEPPEESAKLVFTRHKEAALCICLSKQGDLALSGGQDDIAYLWNTTTGNVLLECTGHNDSVICVGFSCNEKYLATGDMGGLLQAWKLDTREKVWEFEVEDLHWFEWHPSLESVLLCGTQTGAAWLFKITDASQIKNFHGPACANACGKMFKCGTKAVMGYDDGSVRLWDLKSGAVSINIKDKLAHNGGVTCVDVKNDGSLVASGSTDGTAKLINVASGKVLQTFECGRTTEGIAAGQAADDEENSIESVAFGADLPTLATATVKGIIEIWDLSTFVCRCRIKSNAGLSKIKYDVVEPHLLHASCLDGSLMTFDGRSGELLSTQYGHRDQVLDFDISCTNSLAVSASEDTSCRVFDLRQKCGVPQ